MTKTKEYQKLSKDSSRRSFLKTATLAAASLGAFSLISCNAETSDSEEGKSEKAKSTGLQLKIAGYKVNRLKALASGIVKIKGCSIEFIQAAVGDMNSSTFSGDQPYDITEIGLHPYMLAYANDNFRDYTLLPIFPVIIAKTNYTSLIKQNEAFLSHKNSN